MSKLVFMLLLFFISCNANDQRLDNFSVEANYKTIENIPLPPGYERIKLSPGSFGEWLRKVPLKQDNRVFLYNGKLKEDQTVQFAVLDISVGKKDLQQCADAIMRLRAEYLHDIHKSDSISFLATNGQALSFKDWKKGVRYRLEENRLVAYQSRLPVVDTSRALENYLELVFSYAGTMSLQRQLTHKKNIFSIMPGDVFIRAGSPGHAMIVVDVAINEMGHKIFMLAQSYMPAQDIHIVRNVQGLLKQPWYEIDNTELIITPEWTFRRDQLCGW